MSASSHKAPESRGKLKVFLGYAAGVGKTYQMLEEAQRLKSAGVDVVIGYFEPHGRKDTIAKAEGLETLPRRKIEYRGAVFEEMDTDAILRRKPQVCVVDEFAHTNVPGSPRVKRWEDVHVLLKAGIDVLTSLNVQHLESLNDQVWHVTGVRVRETIPDWVVREAGETVMVDVTPRALLHRLERGAVYAPEKARVAIENFFTESNLTALRELALRQAAQQVEEQREESIAKERILIHLTADPTTAMLIRRGRRVADYLHAECLAVYIAPDGESSGPCAEEREAVERMLNFARNLHIRVETIAGKDVAKALTDFARRNKVRQILVSRNSRDAKRIVRNARDMEVTVVAERKR